MHRQLVWDLPIRLFHWLLALAIAAAFATGWQGGNLMEWHGRIGLAVIGLVSFRLVWGFVGSPTARFRHFVRGPGAIRAYLRGHWQGVGHNPLGALSVLALLALVGAQAGTGLFANDDIAFQGPLADLVGKEWSDKLLGIHVLLQKLLLGIVILHVAAITFYLRFKGENLVRPMLTGWKEGESQAAAPAHPRRPGLLAHGVALAFALASVYASAGGLLAQTLPPPPTAAQAASPAW